MSDSRLKRFLAEHPRVATALMSLLFLLTQAAAVVAEGNGSSGP